MPKHSNEALWQCILSEVYESDLYGLKNSMNTKKFAYAKRLYKKRGGRYIMKDISVVLPVPNT
jgi:hypothetical protein